jgi:uncharacterized protein
MLRISRRFTMGILAAALVSVAAASSALAQNTPAPQPQGQGPAGAAQGQRPAGGGMGDRFAGQPRIRALMVAGGCCHDYPTQGGQLMKMLQTELPIDWDFKYIGGTAGPFIPKLYEDPNWYKGYDIVVHNECFTPADSLVSEQYLQNAAAATRARIPAIVIHCAMHTFRAEQGDLWRGILGVRTVRHERAANIPIKIAAAQHPIMAGFKPDWVTPTDELYVIERTLPGTIPLAIGTAPDGKEYPVAWVHESGARVFGTTLGHGVDTWSDPVFQKMMVQGFRWAVGK